MALVKCPFCGESVSDLATQCPHCQNKLTNKVQCNRSGMYSLIAMLLYVAGTILFIISAAVFCSNYKVFDFGVPQSWQIAGVWYIELSKMPVLVYVRVFTIFPIILLISRIVKWSASFIRESESIIDSVKNIF